MVHCRHVSFLCCTSLTQGELGVGFMGCCLLSAALQKQRRSVGYVRQCARLQ